jgi:3-oxoacyl-[acyl-carrier-protein] synthase II
VSPPEQPPARPVVVITGTGAVTGFGWGVAPLFEALARGARAFRAIGRFDAARHRTHLAAEVPAAGRPLALEGLPHADAFAVFAAEEALDAAGLGRRELGPEAAVYFASSTGNMVEAERFFAELSATGGRRARVGLLASQPCSGPAEAVARRLGAAGPSETVSAACASGAMSVARALDALRLGECDLALAGGSDSLCQLTYGGFNALRAVDPGMTRPFREGREGLSMGEGAGVLVLETREHAAARGAVPLAILAGAGVSCDASHMTAPHPEGAGAVRAMRDALADAGLRPDEIDFVNLHGTGTPLNDDAEWAALCAVFGARAREIPVASTKALIGHLLGSAGAVEAVVTIDALRSGALHATPGGGPPAEPPSPRTPVRIGLHGPLAVPGARYALSVNFGFGGANAALVFERAGEPS